MAEQDLKLEARLLGEAPAVLGQPCIVEVALVNAGQKPRIVNGRLAVGYRESVARELFADLRYKASGQPAEHRVVDYDRDLSPPSDYVALRAGDRIARTFDLCEWYAPTAAGSYQLMLYYQGDEPLAQLPPTIVRGVISSTRLELTVLGPSAV